MKRKFWKLVLTCTSKNPNFVEKSTSLAENLEKSWTPRSSWSSFFPSMSVWGVPVYQWDWEWVCDVSQSTSDSYSDCVRCASPLATVRMSVWRVSVHQWQWQGECEVCQSIRDSESISMWVVTVHQLQWKWVCEVCQSTTYSDSECMKCANPPVRVRVSV